MFQNQYALIEEVWNQPVFSPTIVNRYKEAQKVSGSTAEPTDLMVRRALNDKYKVSGLAGVKQLLDDAIVRDIQSEALVKTRANTTTGYTLQLSKEDYMYILLGLFAILFALDSAPASS